jgi:hypothetical protein
VNSDKTLKYFDIELKKDFELKNLLSIPIIMCSMAIVGTFINAESIFILKNPDYFNVPSD